jgi:anti-sigma factor ChrR (cupin superfamily)
MNSRPSKHDQEHSDLVFLYALQALPPGEMQEMQTHIASCADCRKEVDALQPTIDSLVSWPTDVLRPSKPLWGRLAHRIARETGSEPALLSAEASSKPQWEEAAPGIHVKILAVDKANESVSMLVRLEPGTDYPAHRHAGIEELHLLEGVLKVDHRTLCPGDFIHAEAGTVDHRVWSETGCTCFLMTSTKDALF